MTRMSTLSTCRRPAHFSDFRHHKNVITFIPQTVLTLLRLFKKESKCSKCKESKCSKEAQKNLHLSKS